MKKRYVMVALLGALLGAIIAVVVVLMIHNSVQNRETVQREAIDIRYGDNFTILSFTDMNGDHAQLKLEKELSCVFYLSDSCAGCVDVIRNINKIMQIIDSEYVSYNIVWQDRIPSKIIEEYEIPKECCYLLDGNIEPFTAFPCIYILDNMGNIIYYDANVDHAIEKLYSLNIEYYENADEIKANANEYLRNKYDDSEKKLLIYFRMEGCSDCLSADEILESSDIGEEYNVVSVYKYNDTDISHEKDDYGLLRFAYGINWYPSFLRFDDAGNVKFIGECPENEIIEQIKSE